MKKLVTLLLLIIGVHFSNGQTNDHHGDVKPCGHHEATQELLEQLTPAQRDAYYQEQEEFNNYVQDFIHNNLDLNSNNGSRGISYTIPVVFHIIHAGGSENISNEQVEDVIRIMNNDFQKLNSDWENVNEAFIGIVADAEVEFKLARKDPSGNCTNGITRTFSSITYGGNGNQRINAVQNAHGNWPGDRYLNVFVAADIGGAAGYTTYPSNFGGTGMGNGIHVLDTYVGSIGTGTPGRSRTMTHEVGHWLNLPHLWGNSNEPNLQSNCNEDDGVADTPNTIGWTVCNRNGESCGSLDNVENYMEYSYCSKMFTNGQKARMHAAMNSGTGGRNKVVSAANLSFTGVNEPDILCKADFDASARIVCIGQEINFTDYSFHKPTGWTWSFPGGQPSTSSEQNPTVVYNTPGSYQVVLTATDGSGSDTRTRSGYIIVMDESVSLPLMEGFEDYSALNNSSWFVDNPGNNAAFEMVEGIAHTGDKCVRLRNFGQPAGNIDDLISSPIDLSEIESSEGVTLSFRYAFRRRSSNNDDWLRVFLTNDCGDSWSVRRNIRGAQLSNVIETNAWEPTSKDDWTTVHMTNVTSAFWVDNFRVRFQFESDGGNNFFLDDINIYKGDPVNLSVEELEAIQNLNIFPNPASKEVNVAFTMTNSQQATVSLVNLMGQELETFYINGVSGNNLVLIGTENYAPGVYLVKVNINGNQQVKQLVIQ